MSEIKKRKIGDIDQDPDYIYPDNSKHIKLSDYDSYVNIIKKEFHAEVMYKERELEEIEIRLKEAMKTLQLLRSAAVSTYYNRNELVCNTTVTKSFESNNINNSNVIIDSQTHPHPAIKKIIGKAPLQLLSNRTRSKKSSIHIDLKQEINEHVNNINTESVEEKQSEKSESFSKSENDISIRNERFKTKHRIIVGNISKWLNKYDNNQDHSTHKWMIYVRGPKENPDISHIVNKVRFFLHPSYRPNDVIEIKNSPFHLSRRGWGEFPARIQIHFNNKINKPVDIIHNLKLDKTHSGLETLGAETLMDVWLYLNPIKNIQLTGKKSDTITSNKNLVIQKSDNENEFEETFDDISENNYSLEESHNTNPIVNNISPNTNNIASISNNPSPEIVPNCIEFSDLKNHSLDQQSINLNDNKEGKLHFQKDKLCSFKSEQQKLLARQQVVIRWKNNQLKNNHTDIKKDYCNLMKTIYEIHNYCKRDEISEENSQLDNYLINFKEINFSNTISALFYLLRNLPLVIENASDIYYTQFPYIARSRDEFNSWHSTKQFCSEWYRAKLIKRLINDHKIIGHKKWSTKSILILARQTKFSTYSDLKIKKTIDQKYLPTFHSDNDVQVKTFTQINNLQNRLNNIYSEKPKEEFDDENEIDIINIESTKKCNEVPVKLEKETNTKDLVDLSNILPSYLINTSNFVKKAASEIKIFFEPKEFEPNHLAPVNEICISVAIKCFIEDLLRRSLIYSSTMRDNERQIELKDLRFALLSREEFDLFLNCGLGKNIF